MNTYKNLTKFYSKIFVSRIVIVTLNFLVTAYLISKLGANHYGKYITMYSLVNWVFILDIGIGKGMRNKLTNFIESQDLDNASILVSTTVYLTAILSAIFAFIFFVVSYYYDLTAILFGLDDSEYNTILLVFLAVIVVRLFFGALDQILLSSQNSHITVYITSVISLIFYLLLFLVNSTFKGLGSLEVAVLYFISVSLTYICFSLWFFIKNPDLSPSIFLLDSSLVRPLFGSGLKIFSVQMMFFFLIAADRIIILKFLDGSVATEYDILYRIMTLLLFPFSIIAQPLWSSYAAAKANNDIGWIRSIVRRLYLFSLVVLVGVLILSYSFDFITSIWLSRTFNISIQLKLTVGLLIFLIMWSTIHADILYGISALRFMSASIFLGLVFKIIVIYASILSGKMDLYVIVSSSIFGYLIFAITAPFYVDNKLKSLKYE